MTDLTRRRPSAALLVALLALVVALGGTAYAAAKLPKNSVGSPQVKNGSLKAKDLDASSLGKLQVAGDTGPTTVTAQLGDPVETPIKSLSLSRGTWLVRAVLYVINDSTTQPAEPRCNLGSSGPELNEGLTGFYLLVPPLSGNNPSRAQFTLEGTVTVGKNGLAARVTCNENSAIQNFRVGASMTALQVLKQDLQ